jgi:hypothetical protein
MYSMMEKSGMGKCPPGGIKTAWLMSAIALQNTHGLPLWVRHTSWNPNSPSADVTKALYAATVRNLELFTIAGMPPISAIAGHVPSLMPAQ